jgi:hypothetical protein
LIIDRFGFLSNAKIVANLFKNAIIERVHKLRSFDLENENNHENLEEQEDNPFDYFLQSTAWLQSY